MDSDHYRCIFRSTTIVFEITGISVPYSFPTISYRFCFRKKCENESDLVSYRSFPIVFIPINRGGYVSLNNSVATTNCISKEDRF